MAWEAPEHCCGHIGERLQMYGPYKDRERRLAAMERYPCPDCLKRAADEAAKAAGLPPLTGTPKQIAWASDLRAKALASSGTTLLDQLADAPCEPEEIEKRDRVLAAGRAKLAELKGRTRARDWIDARGEDEVRAAMRAALKSAMERI